jgi:hypothetical protein
MIQCVSDSNPFDDEPDFVEEAEKWMKQNPACAEMDPDSSFGFMHEAFWIIKGLCDYIEEET